MSAGRHPEERAPMGDPAIKVLGIYWLGMTDEMVSAQRSILFPGDAGRQEADCQIREQLSSVVLIEVFVENRDEAFDIADFVQPRIGVDADHWQAAWAEAYLTIDGTSLAVERWSSAPQTGDLRIAFFVHYWDRSAPLRSSYGEIIGLEPQPMPDRLARLVPYEFAD
jgi:hypothetical protein